jgi:2-hydroxy-6-oxonona-2,4-dienedioate hydrolase
MSFWTALNGTPHTVRWVAVDGLRLRCLEAGEGDETVLLVHGLGGQIEVFARNIAPLAERYRVVALDLPGHGHSDKPEAEYEIGYYLWALRRCLAGLRILSAHFVGLAMGAWVVSRLAALYPQQVKSLTLIAPAGMHSNQEAMERMKALSAQVGTGREAVRARLEWLLKTPSQWSEELIDVRWEMYRQPDYQKVLPRLMCLQDAEIRARNLLRADEVAAIAQPTFLAQIDGDPSGSFENGTAMEALLPNVTTRLFTQSRHMPQFEEPELFNERLAAFLTGGPHAAFA